VSEKPNLFEFFRAGVSSAARQSYKLESEMQSKKQIFWHYFQK
jgi:hypothetical protein